MDPAVNPANPLSETEVAGGILAGLAPEDQRVAVLGQSAYGANKGQVQGGLLAENFNGLSELDPYQRETLGANPNASDPTPRNYIAPDGRQGVTLDGVTDAATGQSIPQGAQVFTGQVQSADTTPFTTSTQSALEGQEIASQNFLETVKTAREIATQDPTLFGAAGNVRRLAQGVAGQTQNLATLLGGDINSELNEARNQLAGTRIDPTFFDPNLTDIEKVATLLAYEAASAVAGQEGRGLSDRDFNTFRQVVGDPTAWLTDQRAFLSGLDRLETMVRQRLGRTQERLGGTSAGAPPPAGGMESDPLGLR